MHVTNAALRFRDWWAYKIYGNQIILQADFASSLWGAFKGMTKIDALLYPIYNITHYHDIELICEWSVKL